MAGWIEDMQEPYGQTVVMNGESSISPSPLVSVITPVYNAARFIPRVIESVRRQHGVSYEHIFINDFSSDNSLSVLINSSKLDRRIRVINLPNNMGPAIARNQGITVATGRFLAFIDADDIWLPGKLSTQIGFMIEKGAAISFTDYRHITEDGRFIGRRISGPNRIGWSLHHMTR